MDLPYFVANVRNKQDYQSMKEGLFLQKYEGNLKKNLKNVFNILLLICYLTETELVQLEIIVN